MNKQERLYGLADCEHVQGDIETVIEDLVNAASEPGDTMEQACNRVEWPIEVCVFRRMVVSHWTKALADQALENALETLDEELSDPEGDATEPTEAMRAAALEFARVVCAEYVPWACERTGEVMKVTKADALRMMGAEVVNE